MTSFPWLSLIVFLPLAGALLCLLVKAESARWLALGVTVADFVLSLPLWWLFASSLKMCYAAYTKGTTALLAAILALRLKHCVYERMFTHIGIWIRRIFQSR